VSMHDSALLAEMAQRLIGIEWMMVAVFSLGVITWGFIMRAETRTLDASFLAGRKVPGFLAALSTVATNLNANDFIGGAGFVYAVGVVATHGSWVNSLALIFVSLFLVQKLRRLKVVTLGGWLERRYSFTVGFLYSLAWSLVWMLFNLGLYLYAGALVLNTLVGWLLNESIYLLSFIAAAVTLLGGFGAVVATDVLQILLMFFPFIFVAWGSLDKIGGISQIAARLPADKAHFWTNDTPFGSLTVMLLGIFFMGMSYWSSEAQVIQRPLASRSEEDSIISYLGATFWFSILVPLLVSLPALAAVCYFPDLKNPDHAMPSLIRMILPRGLYGVMVVGLMAGVFSSVEAQINSFCAMFTTDIYRRVLVRDRSERHYLIASKLSGAIFTLAAIGTAILFKFAENGMMLFAISVLATIMPPFAAVTILGALAHRVNKHGALVGLIAGVVVAIALVVADKQGHLKSIAKDTLYFRTMVTFLTSAILTWLVSLPTGAPRGDAEGRAIDLSMHWSPRIIRMTLVLLAGLVGMAAFWTYFF